MNRDPFYLQILDRHRTLDGDLFERCADDLLHLDILDSPVRGGDDGGMDGAIPDGEAGR